MSDYWEPQWGHDQEGMSMVPFGSNQKSPRKQLIRPRGMGVVPVSQNQIAHYSQEMGMVPHTGHQVTPYHQSTYQQPPLQPNVSGRCDAGAIDFEGDGSVMVATTSLRRSAAVDSLSTNGYMAPNNHGGSIGYPFYVDGGAEALDNGLYLLEEGPITDHAFNEIHDDDDDDNTTVRSVRTHHQVPEHRSGKSHSKKSGSTKSRAQNAGDHGDTYSSIHDWMLKSESGYEGDRESIYTVEPSEWDGASVCESTTSTVSQPSKRSSKRSSFSTPSHQITASSADWMSDVSSVKSYSTAASSKSSVKGPGAPSRTPSTKSSSGAPSRLEKSTSFGPRPPTASLRALQIVEKQVAKVNAAKNITNTRPNEKEDGERQQDRSRSSSSHHGSNHRNEHRSNKSGGSERSSSRQSETSIKDEDRHESSNSRSGRSGSKDISRDSKRSTSHASTTSRRTSITGDHYGR
ncbi:hypothetical protein F5Y16DRAFT_419752 [Xylariaceae sp. FL0255]|nr:hypothetical protein F5Y16DRAFT_419752 [Xylariaceae sp. FL0255]